MENNNLTNPKTNTDNSEELENNHKFWSTQPIVFPNVSSLSSSIENGPIELRSLSDVKNEPYALPNGFEWVDLDLNDSSVLDDVFNLLERHYVEDDGGSFRFRYDREFLKWALLPPNQYANWLIGIRGVTGKKSLFAMITAIPTLMRIRGVNIQMADVNFLCIHQKLRNRRLAPVLIREVTRRVNLTNRWQAIYTAGKRLPTPVSACPYYHRSLNIKKLIECRFTSMPMHMTMARMIRLYEPAPVERLTLGLHKLTANHIPALTIALNNYLKQFDLAPIFDEHEVAHWFLPRKNVISSFVKLNEQKEVIEFGSYYSVPSSVLNHPVHETINAAYHFYSFSTTEQKEKLLNEMLSLAYEEKFDVFNSVEMMDNTTTLMTNLKFGPGDGKLHFYLYNWSTQPEITPNQIGFTML